MSESVDFPTRKEARNIVLLYLLGFPGAVAMIGIRPALFVAGNPAATFRNILASEMLFRVGIVSELIAATALIFLALALYRFFRRFDEHQASLMAILAIVAVPISFVNVLTDCAVLMLLRSPELGAAFGQNQIEAIAFLLLRLHRSGWTVAAIFWGLWLIPFGIATLRSRTIPRLLGYWLIANGLAYITSSGTALLFPQYGTTVNRIAMLPLLGELWIMLWFLAAFFVPRLLERRDSDSPADTYA